MAEMEFHAAADLFPVLEGEDFDALVEDIQQRGLDEPIALLDGKILDGRNRYRACKAGGVEPKYKTIQTDDPAAYVVSKNLRRRHLNVSQRAMAAARQKEYYAEEGRRAKAEAGKKSAPGRPAEKDVAIMPHVSKPRRKSRKRRAKDFEVSERSVGKADQIAEGAPAHFKDLIDSGQATISAIKTVMEEYPRSRWQTIQTGKAVLEAIRYLSDQAKQTQATPGRGKGDAAGQRGSSAKSRYAVSDFFDKWLGDCNTGLQKIKRGGPGKKIKGAMDKMLDSPQWDQSQTTRLAGVLKCLAEGVATLNDEMQARIAAEAERGE